MAVSSWVDSVEYIEYTLGATALSGSVTLSGTQDIDNCVPFMTSHGRSDYQDAHMLDIYFESTRDVVFKRANQRNNELTIRCYIVEFNPEEVRVQQGSFDLDDQNTDTITLGTTISGVDRAAMTHFWWSSSTSQAGQYHMVRGRVVNTSTVDFYRYNTGSSCQGHWYLFEDLNDNFRVTHSSQSYSNSGQTVVINTDRSCIDPLRSFIIGSWASASSYNYPSRWAARIFLYSDGTMRSDKYDGSYYTVYWAYQIVEFLDKTKIYTPFDNHYLYTFASGDTTMTAIRGGDATMSPFEFNPDTSSVVVAAPMGLCRANTTNATAIDHLYCSVTTSGTTALRFDRNSSDNATYLSTVTVVDWAGIDINIGSNTTPITEGDGPGESFVKSVESFRMTIEDNFSYKVLSKGQDWENCAVFASHYGTSGDATNAQMINVSLIEPGIVCALRWYTGGQGIVDVHVVEFWPNQVKVQQKSVTIASNTTTTIPIEEISDVNKAFITSKVFTSANVARPDYSMVRVKFADTSNVELYRYTAGYEVAVTFFVIEDLKNNFTTKHFDVQSSSNWLNTHDTDHISGQHNTFLISSYASASSYNYPSRGYIRTYLQFEDLIRATKYDSSYYTFYCHHILVKFTSNKRRVQWYIASFTPDTPVTDTYLEEFSGHENALICFNNVQTSTMRCDTTAAGGISESFGSVRITDYGNRTIQFEKNGSSYNSSGGFTLIDWVGYHYQDAHTIKKSVPTKSLVRSVEKLDYYGDAEKIQFYLTKGQNMNQCVPFVTLSSRYNNHMPTLYKRIERYADPDSFVVQFGASNSGADRYFTLYAVEFNDNVKIQHGTSSFDGTSTTVTIEEVDLSRAFLVFYQTSIAWVSHPSPHAVCGHFTSSTEIEFIRNNDSDYMYVAWYVVECLDNSWTVDHGYDTSLGGGSKVYLPMSYTPHINRSLFLASWASSSTNDYPSRGIYMMSPRVDNQIQFSKNDPSYYNMTNANVDVVKLSDDNVKRGFQTYVQEVSLETTTTSGDATMAVETDFDLYRAMVISGNINNEGRVNSTHEYDWDEGYHHYEFKDGKTITYRKTGGTATNTYSYAFAYQWPEYNKYYIEGYVTEKGVPVQRTVCLHRSSTGDLIDSTTSASGTGYFLLETPYGEKHYAVCLDDEAPPSYNHLIYGKLMPTVISGSFAFNEGLVTTSGFDIGVPLCYQDEYM